MDKPLKHSFHMPIDPGVSHSQRRAEGRRPTRTLEAVFLIFKIATIYDSPEVSEDLAAYVVSNQ